MTQSKFANRVPAVLSLLAKPYRVAGETIELFKSQFDLHLAEIGLALGMNTASLYKKKKKGDEPEMLNSSLSILIRLYAGFSDKIPRTPLPSADEFLELIKSVEPSFRPYMLGPLVGHESNSGYALTRSNFKDASQTTRTLIWLIYTLVKEDPANWQVIKEVVELEADAHGISDKATLWKKGGWGRNNEKALKREQTSKSPRPNKQMIAESTVQGVKPRRPRAPKTP